MPLLLDFSQTIQVLKDGRWQKTKDSGIKECFEGQKCFQGWDLFEIHTTVIRFWEYPQSLWPYMLRYPQSEYNKPHLAVICDMKPSNDVQDDMTFRNSMGFHDNVKITEELRTYG